MEHATRRVLTPPHVHPTGSLARPREISMFKLVVPILGVARSVDSEAFYNKLGFRRAYAYRPSKEKPDPGYLGVVRDGAHIALSSFPGDGPPGESKIQIYVDDIVSVR